MAAAAPHVVHLFISVAHRLPMRAVDSAQAVAGKGLDGCVHARPGHRQVLLMDEETLGALGIEPGAVKENVTTRGVALAELGVGQRLRVGGALLEVTGPCAPCDRMNEIRAGLEQELRGRRGVLCRVVEGGPIHRGDEIVVLDYAKVAD